LDLLLPNPDGTTKTVSAPDPAAIPMDAWQKISDFMISRGYDWRGAQDAKEIFERLTGRGTPMEGDHAQAVAFSLGLANPSRPKKPNNLHPRTLDKIIRHFGLTDDLLEAGYILPNGGLLDFSGKREGGMPGERAMDHRDIGAAWGHGGTAGMLKFMQAGAVRIDSRSGVIDLNRTPTEAQLGRIGEIIRLRKGEVRIECEDGLYWEPGTGFPRANRSFRKDYDRSTAPYAIKDIRDFYSGKQPKVAFSRSPGIQTSWVRQNCKFAKTMSAILAA